MKTTKIISGLMAIVFGMFTLSSCGSDDDEPAVPAAQSVAGTYHGDMTCSVMGQESTFEDMTFTLIATDDATVDIEISTFGNPPMQVPAITIKDVKVSGADGSYTLATTSFEGDLENGKKYSGTIEGTNVSGVMTLRFNLNYGAMPMPMICTFTAPKN